MLLQKFFSIKTCIKTLKFWRSFIFQNKIVYFTVYNKPFIHYFSKLNFREIGFSRYELDLMFLFDQTLDFFKPNNFSMKISKNDFRRIFYLRSAFSRIRRFVVFTTENNFLFQKIDRRIERFEMETSQKQEFLVTTTLWDPAQVITNV